MSKGKNFRDWVEEDYSNSREKMEKMGKKPDSKRYDSRKSDIQKARRQKQNHKDSLYK
jgi:hypothetical protein